MKTKIFLICLIFLLIIGVVISSSINFISNKITASVTIKSECNDGIDNDGDGLIDDADTNCLDSGKVNLCHNENGSVTNNCI